MKFINLLVALLFTISLAITAGPVEGFAKSEKKETAATTAKKATKKQSSSTKKEVAKKKAKKDTTKKTTAKKSVKKKAGKTTAKLKPKSIPINSANKAVLSQLPGVGDKTADAIIAYRKTNGKFKSVNDLKNVKGIGDKKLGKMKQYLKL